MVELLDDRELRRLAVVGCVAGLVLRLPGGECGQDIRVVGVGRVSHDAGLPQPDPRRRPHGHRANLLGVGGSTRDLGSSAGGTTSGTDPGLLLIVGVDVLIEHLDGRLELAADLVRGPSGRLAPPGSKYPLKPRGSRRPTPGRARSISRNDPKASSNVCSSSGPVSSRSRMSFQLARVDRRTSSGSCRTALLTTRRFAWSQSQSSEAVLGFSEGFIGSPPLYRAAASGTIRPAHPISGRSDRIPSHYRGTCHGREFGTRPDGLRIPALIAGERDALLAAGCQTCATRPGQ